MAISDSEKLDLLWKKVGFGVSKTATAGAKAGSNETVSSPLPVYSADIWTQTSATFIPPAPPASTTSVVAKLFGAQAIRMTNDATSAPNVTWLATTSFGDANSRIGDFIPATFGPGYVVQVYLGNPATKAARIFPDATGEEFAFDYVAGVLNFIGGLPTSKPASIGTGTVSLTDGVYIQVYRYVGIKGVAAAGSTSKNYVVADIAARDALTGLSAGDFIHVVDASGIPADASAGEYANYLWTGSAFSLVSTKDSARTDALTSTLVITPASPASISLGKIGNGARVVEVSVAVDTPFDGTFDIVIGDAVVADRLLDLNEADLKAIGNYVSNPVYVFPVGAETELKVSVTGTATVGHATVALTYA
jgi:hypothetical protein